MADKKTPREQLMEALAQGDETAMELLNRALRGLKERHEGARAEAADVARKFEYTVQHRRERASEAIVGGAREIMATANEWKEALKPELSAWQKATQGAHWPSAGEAALYLYVRDLLAARHTADEDGMHAIAGEWRKALLVGDLVAVRVFRDHAATWWNVQTVSPITGGGAITKRAPLPVEFAELERETNVALRTPEQIAAEQRLEAFNGVNAALEKHAKDADGLLDYAIGEDDELVNARDERRKFAMRSTMHSDKRPSDAMMGAFAQAEAQHAAMRAPDPKAAIKAAFAEQIAASTGGFTSRRWR